MALNKVGGILMLVSLFIPTVLIMIGPIIILVWMFGLTYWLAGPFSGVLFLADIIGIALTVVILVFSILCIVKDSGETRVFGILALVFVCVYYGLLFVLFAAMVVAFGLVGIGVIVVPFIGFFGIFVGAILNIAAKP